MQKRSNNVLLKHYVLEMQKLEAAYALLQQQFYALKRSFETSHQRLDQVVNHILEGLIFVSKEGAITLFNPAAVALTGLSNALALQGTYWDHFQDRFFGFSMRESLLTTTTHRRIFLTLQQEIDVEVSTSSIPEKGVILVLSDRSEQQKLQKSLNQAERLKELGEMAAVLAHEIRNPLSGIEGFAQLLKRDLEQPNHQQMLHAILEGTQTLNCLVNNVLDYSRPMHLHFESTDLITLMQEVIAWMETSDHQPHYTLSSPFTTYQVSIDKAQIKLVLLNILRNACEAGAHNITIKIDQEGDISVKDDGCGMHSKHKEKIFSPFFTTKSRGTGLGLAHSLAVMKAHGGTIDVVSEEGHGTLLTLKLKELCALKKY